ncbi:hypothetical protein [Legionella sp.]|uniref:hypothetical protein n=1 Tax=Legionella sp. TaxID=459 RepID=UPI000CC99750|nr:hypothetical protein [Legionella sp.]PJE08141.1 MAG: hypothetical protein CK430_12905 [Legionella sp.]
MGFFDAWEKVKGWSARAWNEATPANIGIFSYKTAGYILSMPRAALSAGNSVISDPNTRVFAMHMAGAGLHIFIPMVFSYLNDEIQRRGQTYLHEDEEQELLSTDTLIITGLTLLSAVVWIIDKREDAQEAMQAGILTLESSNVVLPQLPTVKICQDCTSLRFLKGSFRDFITYWSTKLILIEGVRYIPGVGEWMALTLTVFHNGSYIATLIWSPLCGRHLDHNLNEHPEFTLAQGLTHMGTSILIVSAIEWGTGIPRDYYQTSIQQLAIVGQVLLGAHGELPVFVKHSDRLPKDPVRAYEIAVKYGIDGTLTKSREALQVVLPKVEPIFRPLLNRLPKAPTIPWNKIGNVVVVIWSHKATKVVKYFVLPSMLQGPEEFVNDHLVRHHWRGLRDKVISAMIDLEKVSKNYAFRLISAAPETTGEAVEVVMGTPKIITEAVLRLLRNKTFMDNLAAKRRDLEGIHSGAPPETQPDPDAPLMRGQIETANIIPHSQIVEEVDDQNQSQKAGQTEAPSIRFRIPTEEAMERKLRLQSSDQLEDRLDSRPQSSSNDAQLEERLTSRGRNRSEFFTAKPKPAQIGLEDFEVVNPDFDELGDDFEMLGDREKAGKPKTSAFV